MYLLLDGVVGVEVDGQSLGEVGPGAILGERAVIESGRRTAALRAITDVRLAIADVDQIDRGALEAIGADHRREGPDA